jgi:hypothetical protein
MKKIPTIGIAFVAGIILGATTLSLFSFSGSGTLPVTPAPEISKMSLQDAQASFRRYYDNASPVNEAIKGFAINKEQLAAMNSLSNENPNLAGFRIYMGIDNNSTGVEILLGIDNTGRDNANTIYRTSSGSSGPCPPICDQSSSIIAN